jgi:hypothetical protein
MLKSACKISTQVFKKVSYLILMILLHQELISDHLQLQNHLGEAPLLVYEGLATEGLLQGGTMRVQLGIAANHTTQTKISITLKKYKRAIFDGNCFKSTGVSLPSIIHTDA